MRFKDCTGVFPWFPPYRLDETTETYKIRGAYHLPSEAGLQSRGPRGGPRLRGWSDRLDLPYCADSVQFLKEGGSAWMQYTGIAKDRATR